MVRRIAKELKEHAPFTILGAFTGIIIMIIVVWGGFLPRISLVSQNIFYILHPTHVFLSALVTTSLYTMYGKRKIWLVILIGFTGSIGIATISDSVFPYLGETMLDLPNRGMHIGFIEEPLRTNPAAFLGIAVGYSRAKTKFPHSGHVLISTWASLFHVIMALGQTLNCIQIIFILLFLFLAVWIPCCTSDIVYPLLFVRKEPEPPSPEGREITS